MRFLLALMIIISAWSTSLVAQTLGDPATGSPSARATSDPLPYGLFVSPTISTLGIGLETGVRLNESFGVRFGGNWLSVDFDRTVDDVDYEADATLASLGTLLDYHPFRGGFRLSGGLRFNFNEAGLTGVPNGDVTIGDQTFAASDVGTLEGDVSYDVVAPYIGLGYGATLLQGALTIGFDLGVMYQGKADVDLDARGGALEGNAVLEANLAIEEEDIEDDLEDFIVYPVIGLAAVYRF